MSVETLGVALRAREHSDEKLQECIRLCREARARGTLGRGLLLAGHGLDEEQMDRVIDLVLKTYETEQKRRTRA